VLPDILHQMAIVIAHPDEGAANKFAAGAMWKTVGILAPMLIGMMVVGLMANVAQVGFKPTSKKLKPDFSRLNVFKGIKKMVGVQAWWELGKAIAKTVVLIAVAWPAFTHAMTSLSNGSSGGAFEIAGFTAKTALTILRNVSVAGLAIAGADYAYQKRRTSKQLRMTRQELREEMKQQEGNPEMRRSIRSRAMAISRNQMIRAVSAADVVVVNPTHFAVALKYDSAKGAPQVVAKGAGAIAAGIRTQAERNGIPIVHEPVLTRTLYKACEIGQLIPPDLFEAVAHLLAFVFGLRAKGRADGYHEMPRPVLL
jgi:flagellar biosynthetic protein FlhB